MDIKKFNLYMSILKIGLVGIGVILCLFIIGGPNMENTLETQEIFREGVSMNLITSFTGFIIFASIGLILLFFVLQLISNPKKTILSIIGLLAALVLYLFFLMIGTSDTNESLALLEDVQVAQGTIRSSSAGIYTVVLAVFVALMVAVFGPLLGRYRK